MANPVRRLLDILERARGAKGPKTFDAWADVLNVSRQDNAAVLFAVGELYRLVEDAQAAALDASQDMNPDVIDRPFRQLTTWLQGMNLQANWDGFKGRLSSDTLTGLRFCAEIIDREHGDADLTEEELEEFRARAEELVQEVGESDLPDELRTVLRDSLWSFIRAADQYNLRGLDGLGESVNSSVGSVLRHQDQVKDAENSAVLSKYLLFLVAVEKAIAVAEKARPMLEPVVRALLPGGEPSE